MCEPGGNGRTGDAPRSYRTRENGEHAHQLGRIEHGVDELHDKIDKFAEAEAANSADIVWLKWGFRLTLAAAAGVGGATVNGLV